MRCLLAFIRRSASLSLRRYATARSAILRYTGTKHETCNRLVEKGGRDASTYSRRHC
jgi:hypothetical protein